jgi:phage tail-like protein
MPVYRDYDPVPAYMFGVEIEGQSVGVFTECSGIEMEREVEEYREGGANDLIMQFPGRIKVGRLTLRRGVMTNSGLWDWFNIGIYNGQVKKVNMSVKVFRRARAMEDTEYKLIQRWDFTSCWPVKYDGPELSAESLQPAIEGMEIAWDGLVFSSDFT